MANKTQKVILGSSMCMMLMAFSAPSMAKPITLRVADSFPATHWLSVEVTKYMMKRVTELTNNDVEFQYYPSEQLGKAKDLLALSVSGVTDIAYVAPAFVGDKMPLSVVGELPLPARSESACPGTMAYWKIAKPGGILDQKEFAPNGVRLLFTVVLPPYQLVTKSQFSSLQDIKGMKIRTSGAPKELALRTLGAVPIQIPSPEINEAMGRGTVDGALLPIGSVRPYGLDASARYFTVGENFGSFVANYVISERKWKSLPPQAQKALEQIGEEVSKRGCDIADQQERESIQFLKEKGIKQVDLPQSDVAPLRNMQNSVGKEWAQALDKRNKAGTEILNAYLDAMKQQH
ncbi:TRAP transporter substrate-binding protein DctP [Alcaligenaceae bacterium]|nr:TRAP transporter substrate-binding protein DctP [Alcaligenaceae bacterium]